MIIVIMGEGDAEAASEAETVTVGFEGQRNLYFKKIFFLFKKFFFLARFLPVLKRSGSRELSLTVIILNYKKIVCLIFFFSLKMIVTHLQIQMALLIIMQ